MRVMMAIINVEQKVSCSHKKAANDRALPSLATTTTRLIIPRKKAKVYTVIVVAFYLMKFKGSFSTTANTFESHFPITSFM